MLCSALDADHPLSGGSAIVPSDRLLPWWQQEPRESGLGFIKHYEACQDLRQLLEALDGARRILDWRQDSSAAVWLACGGENAGFTYF